MDKKILLLIFLISGFAFSQTTVTLEDQCNCEVLSGTTVTAPGVTSPTGADTGDIYVNTNTGTIYFWDGDSWELTSSDDQQVLDFSFNPTTSELTLELENGGAPIVVALPVETLTTLTLNGNSLEYLDENNNTNVIPLNVGSLALGADGNSLDYTDEDSNTTNIPLNVGTLAFNPITRELTYTDEASTPTVITLPTETVTTLSTSDGVTYTYTSEDTTATSFDGTDDQDLGIGPGGVTNESVELTITGGASTVIDIRDADASVTNEVNTRFEVSGANLEIEDGNGTLQVPLADINAGVDTDDQDLQGFQVNGADLEISIQDGNTVSVPLADINAGVDTDDQDISTDGSAGNISIEAGSTLTLNVDDADASVTNEVNTRFEVSGANLEIEDGNGTLQVPLADINAGVDTDDQDLQNFQVNGTDLEISIQDGNTVSVPLADINAGVDTDDQDISTDGSAGNISIEAGSTLTLNVDDADASVTNEVNTRFEVSGANLEIEDGNGTLQVPLADINAGVDTDDQQDFEVLLRTPIDMDEAGEASPTNETNVEEVIQAIAPITSKAARIFYPPSIAIDASSPDASTRTLNLYNEYIAQFGTPAVSSAGAPNAIPTYAANELYYYVTLYDTNVLTITNISNTGVMTYTVDNTPADYNSLINVVFVVR